MSCLTCCFGCLTCCGCRDRVCQRLVFFPPVPFYAIEQRGQQQTLWLVEEGQKIEPYASSNMKMAFIETRKDSTVCTMWLRYPGSTTTILFSHGNATDIGCMRDHIIDFARQLKVNVLIYDYTGYGLSAGLPAMSHTLADSEAAYDYLLRTYPNESTRIIVYGQSLGSGPTLHLSRKRRVNGVVIHSGIMSALRVLHPQLDTTRWFDIYPNIDLIRSTRAHVFVIHGTEDKEIPIEHGRGLSEAAHEAFKPWWVEGAGHNNIEVEFREMYFAKLDQFVRYIEAKTPPCAQLEDPLTEKERKEMTKTSKRAGQESKAAMERAIQLVAVHPTSAVATSSPSASPTGPTASAATGSSSSSNVSTSAPPPPKSSSTKKSKSGGGTSNGQTTRNQDRAADFDAV